MTEALLSPAAAPSLGDILAGDFHVHSTFSDDAVSTIEQNLAAATARGLTNIRCIDHVRESTTWVPEFVAAVRFAAPLGDLAVLTGVEAKIMDARGTLDLPAGFLGVDAVVIADHQFPGRDGPLSPSAVRALLADGLAPEDALDTLVGALIGAMNGVDSAQLAHCFSILPKIGLSEDDLSDEHLAAWAATAASTGTSIEVNEKWACPGPRAIRAAVDAGAAIVGSTDSHVASDVGRYSAVGAILTAAGIS